jgi:CheY-like chemotaxis protein
VVDDIADNYFLLQMILKLEGYQVEVADSGYAALERVEANLPDLILLDVMMPGIDGFEVTRRIRQNTRLPFIPILLITGHNQLEEARAFNMGANGLLYKPIDLDRLLEQVRHILGERLSHLKNG